jgi:hypothetical protein
VLAVLARAVKKPIKDATDLLENMLKLVVG